MKKIILLALLATSICFGQKHKHNNKHKHNGNHHNHHVQKPNYNFWFGMALLDAISGNNNSYYHDYGWSDNTVMEMHFRYIPRRDEWVLQRKRRNVQAAYFLDYGKPRIVATFENPMYNDINSWENSTVHSMLHDYSIIVHRDGYWEYDCPEDLRRYFSKKIKNNIRRWR